MGGFEKAAMRVRLPASREAARGRASVGVAAMVTAQPFDYNASKSEHPFGHLTQGMDP
jgi:hypothetical protein